MTINEEPQLTVDQLTNMLSDYDGDLPVYIEAVGDFLTRMIGNKQCI